MNSKFLPVTPEEVRELGREVPDFVYVTGDAYVDHPSFGPAIISRVLEDAGYVVAMLPQPDYKSCNEFKKFGRPRLGFLVTAGNIDSMVAHYTVSKKKRNYDYYSPGGKMGKRPDRAVIVYCNRIREAYGDVPIIIGGLEASLRRFAHYDYWDEKVRRSILVDSRADILEYGMGEKTTLRVAELLDRGIPVKKICDVRGTCYLANRGDKIHYPSAVTDANGAVSGYDYDALKNDKRAYAEAFAVQYKNNDAVSGKAIVEYYDGKMLVQNPPMPPLETEELDRVYALPYTREWHPMYESEGGVPGIAEVKFSITHNRGCFGGCNFCALAFHQGRSVRSRSIESVVKEAKLITEMPDFKGYIHDVGGPTANFRHPACKKQLKYGVCQDRRCLVPKPCPNLDADHSEYVQLLSEIQKIPKIKKVFIRSGIRFDYLLCDKDETFFKKLVTEHTSGQLKVAPEHCTSHVLSCMGKPDIAVYDKFRRRFFEISEEAGLKQFLVPYLMSSHPGSTLRDAVELAVYMKKIGLNPEQVQDFYPTPGTVSTVMYYTGYDPLTKREIYCTTDYREKQLQRALLQFYKPENRPLVREALVKCGREDLIGYGAECLVRPDNHRPYGKNDKNKGGTPSNKRGTSSSANEAKGSKGAKNVEKDRNNKSAADSRSYSGGKRPAGWAKPKPKGNKGSGKFSGKKSGGRKAASGSQNGGIPEHKIIKSSDLKKPHKGKGGRA